MDGILEKLDSYNILTNLLPGAFFLVGLRLLVGLELPAKSVAEEIVLYYFVGLVISRIGSLVTEPLLKKVRWLEFAPHPDFIAASRLNPKINVLSEMNDHYRSLLTATVCIPAVWGAKLLTESCPFFAENWKWFLVFGVGVLFLFSYRKQTAYVRKHVEKALKPKA